MASEVGLASPRLVGVRHYLDGVGVILLDFGLEVVTHGEEGALVCLHPAVARGREEGHQPSVVDQLIACRSQQGRDARRATRSSERARKLAMLFRARAAYGAGRRHAPSFTHSWLRTTSANWFVLRKSNVTSCPNSTPAPRIDVCRPTIGRGSLHSISSNSLSSKTPEWMGGSLPGGRHHRGTAGPHVSKGRTRGGRAFVCGVSAWPCGAHRSVGWD